MCSQQPNLFHHVWRQDLSHNQRRFDAIVIGSRQGGTPLAISLAGEGWDVALVERKAVGGTCVNEGCAPTKTMIASARIEYLVQLAGDFGVDVSSFSINLERVIQRKRQVVESFREGIKKRILNSQNLSLIKAARILPEEDNSK